jgi:hypothetical protein
MITCPICNAEIVYPLARQKMFRHLLAHSVSEETANNVAMEVPVISTKADKKASQQ